MKLISFDDMYESLSLNYKLFIEKYVIVIFSKQSLILNDINNGVPERCCDTSITNIRNNISQVRM